MSTTLRLTAFTTGRDRFGYSAELAGRTFTTRFRFDTVDFEHLEALYGPELMRSIYFHAIGFDVNRLASLRPERIDFGPFSDQVTQGFATLWRQIFDGVWSQWRYENDLPDYPGPEIIHPLVTAEPHPIQVGGATKSLVFCGGGKDSLLAAKLFEELGEPFDSFAYSHSIYGAPELQHQLIDALLGHCGESQRHRLWIEDDFLGSVDPSSFGVRTITAAETPGGLFLSLPLALAHGLENLVVAHEKSADTGNLIWEATGEEINHQWGKSLEAEALLDEYVRRHLIADVRYFSILKSVQDTVIFPALGDYPEAIPATHSCNEDKPWCRRCAKCVYVWLGYAAWLPRETVLAAFGENLFDVEANLTWFARLLGFEEHLPFECVGQVEESCLALALAARRGWTGLAVERFAEAAERSLDPRTLPKLFAVEGNPHRIPERLAQRVVPALSSRARSARKAVERALESKKEGGREALPKPGKSRGVEPS